jgi:hypothetical protein
MSSRAGMHSRLRPISLSFLAVALLILMVGCGGGGGGGNNNPSTSVSVVIFPGTVTVPINGTVVFSATVYNATNTAVNWAATGGATFMGNVMTAPATPGPVTVTATSQSDSSKMATVAVTVTAAQPVSVSPSAVAVPARGMQQFTASSGGQAVVWGLPAPPLGVDFGSIDQNGLYTAPAVPPPGGTVTISAVTATNGAGVANVTIVFSDASLSGQYAFAYSGQDTAGFLAVAGSMTFDGLGNIVNGGVEDVNSGNGVVTNAITGGTYDVGPDGRAIVSFTTSLATVTFQVTVVSPHHGFLVRFDTVATGSGTLDLQNKAEFSVSSIANFYSFAFSGVNSGSFPEAIAGNFFADGNGIFPNGIQDVNNAGTVTQADTSLQGQVVTFDNNSGRGLLQFTSTAKGTLSFAFYMVDRTHLKLVETDTVPILAGDVFSAPNSITLATLKGNFAFTLGGSVPRGAFAGGGIFVSNGTGGVTKGVQDLNLNGSVETQTIASTGSTYTVTPISSNRILLNIANGKTTFIYGVYFNSDGSAEMIELDTNVTVASGLAFSQSSTAAAQGNYALNLTGAVGTGEEDVNGSIASSGAAAITGYLDANNTGSVFPNLQLSGSTSTAPTPLGRGTITLQTAAPSATTFALAYYVVDNQTFLIVEIDGQRVMLGTMARQF